MPVRRKCFFPYILPVRPRAAPRTATEAAGYTVYEETADRHERGAAPRQTRQRPPESRHEHRLAASHTTPSSRHQMRHPFSRTAQQRRDGGQILRRRGEVAGIPRRLSDRPGGEVIGASGETSRARDCCSNCPRRIILIFQCALDVCSQRKTATEQ